MGKYLDMKNKKCIVFDVDGTICDTKNGIIKALNYVLNMYGKSFISHDNEDLYIGPSIKESLMKLWQQKPLLYIGRFMLRSLLKNILHMKKSKRYFKNLLERAMY